MFLQGVRMKEGSKLQKLVFSRCLVGSTVIINQATIWYFWNAHVKMVAHPLVWLRECQITNLSTFRYTTYHMVRFSHWTVDPFNAIVIKLLITYPIWGWTNTSFIYTLKYAQTVLVFHEWYRQVSTHWFKTTNKNDEYFIRAA